MSDYENYCKTFDNNLSRGRRTHLNSLPVLVKDAYRQKCANDSQQTDKPFKFLPPIQPQETSQTVTWVDQAIVPRILPQEGKLPKVEATGLEEFLNGAKIRVDANTKQVSVIDVAAAVTGKNKEYASKQIRLVVAGNPKLSQYLTDLRINNKGKPTPVCNAATAVEIIWLLPGKAAREVRRHHATQICRILGGDLTLVTEMEIRVMGTSDQNRAVMMNGIEECPAMQNPEFRARNKKRGLKLQQEKNRNAKKARIHYDKEQQALGHEAFKLEIEARKQKAHYDLLSTRLQSVQLLSSVFAPGSDTEDARIYCELRNRLKNYAADHYATEPNENNDSGVVHRIAAADTSVKDVYQIIKEHLEGLGHTEQQVTKGVQLKVTKPVGKIAARLFREKYSNNKLFLKVTKFINDENQKINAYECCDHHLVIEAYKLHMSSLMQSVATAAPRPTPQTIDRFFSKK